MTQQEGRVLNVLYSACRVQSAHMRVHHHRFCLYELRRLQLTKYYYCCSIRAILHGLTLATHRAVGEALAVTAADAPHAGAPRHAPPVVHEQQVIPHRPAPREKARRTKATQAGEEEEEGQNKIHLAACTSLVVRLLTPRSRQKAEGRLYLSPVPSPPPPRKRGGGVFLGGCRCHAVADELSASLTVPRGASQVLRWARVHTGCTYHQPIAAILAARG